MINFKSDLNPNTNQQTVSVCLLVPLRIQSAAIVSRTGVPILIVVTALKVVSFNPGISTSNGSNVLLAKYGLRYHINYVLVSQSL